MQILFVRHGESQANLDRVFANRVGFPGDLTPAGMAQAYALAGRLAGRGVTHVYTSPLPRATQTAAIVATELDVPCTADDALREYDVGDFEGLPYAGDHAWRWDQYEAVAAAWLAGDLDARHSGGESLADLRDRFLPFIQRLTERHPPDDVLVAVGHGGLYHGVLPLLLPNITPAYAATHGLGHGDMVVALLGDGGGWRCTQWGDASFQDAR